MQTCLTCTTATLNNMSRDAGHTLKKFTFRTWWGNPSRALDVAMPHSGCSTAWSCLQNNSDVRWKCFRCVWSSQTHFSTDRHISILFPVVSPTFLCFTKDWKYFCSFFTIGNILWGYTLLVIIMELQHVVLSRFCICIFWTVNISQRKRVVFPSHPSQTSRKKWHKQITLMFVNKTKSLTHKMHH